MDQSKASRGLWASSRFKPYAMFTHEEQRETCKMHTCAYSMGSKPHSFWVCMAIHVKCASRIAINESTKVMWTWNFEQSQVMQIKSKANHTKP